MQGTRQAPEREAHHGGRDCSHGDLPFGPDVEQSRPESGGHRETREDERRGSHYRLRYGRWTAEGSPEQGPVGLADRESRGVQSAARVAEEMGPPVEQFLLGEDDQERPDGERRGERQHGDQDRLPQIFPAGCDQGTRPGLSFGARVMRGDPRLGAGGGRIGPASRIRIAGLTHRRLSVGRSLRPSAGRSAPDSLHLRSGPRRSGP